MSGFLCIDLPEFSQSDGDDASAACVCCLSKDCSLINITNCRHAFILEKITNFKIYLQTVCHKCHGFLEKIDLFMQLVEKSQKILSSQSKQKPAKRKFKPKIRGTYTLDDKDYASDSTLSQFEILVKAEPLSDGENESLAENYNNQVTDNDLNDGDSKVDLKNQQSDTDSEIPLSKLKKTLKTEVISESKNETLDKRFKSSKIKRRNLLKGKIKVLHLSEEQMREERLKDAQRPSFLKFRYKCQNCIVGFDHQQMYDDHMKKHVQKKDGIACEICTSVLCSKESHQIHVKRHYVRYKCEPCGKRYLNRYTVLRHHDSAHAPPDAARTFSCDQCEFVTNSNRRFRYHASKHKARVACELCGNKLVNKCALKVHLLTVHKQSTTEYRCEPCGKLYRARSGLMEHNKAHHAATHAMFYCVECDLHFKTGKNLRKHLKENVRHRAGDRFECSQCEASFQKQPSLRQHVEFVHNKTVRFDCDTCAKTFASQRALTKHTEFVHEKKRPPRNKMCDYCGRGFTTTQILRTHIRTHTRERPLHCSRCAASFAHPAALYTHSKIHDK